MGIVEDRKIELLVPAGSAQGLRAVIEAGCDAVYIGGSRFGARAYADNPGEEELLEAIDYAHLHGVKVYLTVNTLFKDTELEELFAYLSPYYERGLDAVIVQDYGVMREIGRLFPGLPIHISTQMTITNSLAEELLPDTVTRIVPARELSLSEIEHFRKQSRRELEIFVHGALCYSYSGQCLMSSMIGGRSGNRGRCAQPCRKEYSYSTDVEHRKNSYWLSPKDQCLLPRLGELLETGIHSLKIEGRMKRSEYAAGVTAIYRRWVDRYQQLGKAGYERYVAAHEDELKDDMRRLAELYNRGGFCSGYAFDEKGPAMMATSRPNHTGVQVGAAKLTWDRNRLSAQVTFTESLGAGDVLELRGADETIYKEFTVAKDGDATQYRRITATRAKEWRGTPQTAKVYRMHNDSLLASIREQYIENRKPIALCGVFSAEVGGNMSLQVYSEDGAYTAYVTGELVQQAGNAPATDATVRKQLMKTGDSGYAWKELTIELGDGCFLPVSQLNELRRRALAAYQEEVLRDYRRSSAEVAKNSSPAEVATNGSQAEDDASGAIATSVTTTQPVSQATSDLPKVLISVLTKEQYAEAKVYASDTANAAIAIDMDGDCVDLLCGAKEQSAYVMLPRVSKPVTRSAVEALLPKLLSEGAISGIVVRTLDQLVYVKRLQEKLGTSVCVVTDTTLPVMNEEALAWLLENGATAVTFSHELRREELAGMADGGYVTVYGRDAVMVTEQCVRKTAEGCGTSGFATLRDARNAEFPVRNLCRYCYNILYNAHTTSLLPYMEQVESLSCKGLRLDFTTETATEMRSVLTRLDATRLGEKPAAEENGAFTRGHWRRGVE